MRQSACTLHWACPSLPLQYPPTACLTPSPDISPYGVPPLVPRILPPSFPPPIVHSLPPLGTVPGPLRKRSMSSDLCVSPSTSTFAIGTLLTPSGIFVKLPTLFNRAGSPCSQPHIGIGCADTRLPMAILYSDAQVEHCMPEESTASRMSSPVRSAISYAGSASYRRPITPLSRVSGGFTRFSQGGVRRNRP